MATKEEKRMIKFLANFLTKHDLTADEFKKIQDEGRINKTNTKILRDFKAKTLALKIIGAPIKNWTEKKKQIREEQDLTTLHSEEQQEAEKELLKRTKETPAYKTQQPVKQPSPISDEAKRILGIAVGKEPTERAKKIQSIGEKGIDIASQYGPELMNIMQQRGFQAPERAPFGQETDSRLLSDYDQLVNAIRPQRTGLQKTAAAIEPYTSAIGGAAGKALGTGAAGLGSKLAAYLPAAGAGGALGAAISSPALLGLAGAGLGAYGLGKGVSRLAQPRGEFASIGDYISGQQPGMLSRARQGIGGLISGQDQSFLPSLMRTIGIGEKPGRLSKFRQGVGNLIGGEQPGLLTKFRRGVGGTISSPGAAQNLRNILEGGQALYGIAEQFGIPGAIGRGARSLGRRLGLVGPEQPRATGRELGSDITNLLAANLARRGGGFLENQASQFFGKPTTINRQQLAQDINANLAPLMARYNIEQAQLGSKRAKLGLQKQAVRRDKAISIAKANAAQAAQQQKFQQAMQKSGLSEQEALARAQQQAISNRLDTEQLLAGQEVRFNRPMIRQRAYPTVLDQVSEAGFQNITRPYLQQAGKGLYESLSGN